MSVKYTREVTFDLSARDIGEAWAEMDDDAQAQFFVHAARAMGRWRRMDLEMQLFAIGRHLAKCECSTMEARELVLSLAESVRDAFAESKP